MEPFKKTDFCHQKDAKPHTVSFYKTLWAPINFFPSDFDFDLIILSTISNFQKRLENIDTSSFELDSMNFEDGESAMAQTDRSSQLSSKIVSQPFSKSKMSPVQIV